MLTIHIATELIAAQQLVSITRPARCLGYSCLNYPAARHAASGIADSITRPAMHAASGIADSITRLPGTLHQVSMTQFDLCQLNAQVS